MPAPILTLFLLATIGASLAQEAEPVSAGDGIRRAEAWTPTPPAEDTWDWVRMNSGEWLKGEIESFSQGEVVFDSDEFDLQTLDIDDIAELRSPRQNTIRTEDGAVWLGRFHLHGDVLVVWTATERHELSRSELNRIVPGDASEDGIWSGEVSFGLTARSGNSDQTDTTLYTEVIRQTAATRLRGEYTGTLAEIDGTQTTNNHRGLATYDNYLTRTLFWRIASLEYNRDRFQNIAHRITPGTGLGVTIFDDGDLQWSVVASGAYRSTEFRDVGPGEDSREETGVIVLSTEFEKDLSARIEFSLDYSLTVPVPASHEYNHHLRVAFETELTDSLDLDLSVIWDRVNRPEANDSGIEPDSDDLRMVVGLGYDF